LTWPLRAKRFAPQVMPSGSIFSVRGYAAFPEPGNEMSTLAVFNSNAFDFIFKTALGRFGFPEFIVGILQCLPWCSWSLNQRKRVISLAELSVVLRRLIDSTNDTSRVFMLPALLQTEGATLVEQSLGYAKRISNIDAELFKIQYEIDNIAFDLYGFTEEERKAANSGNYSRADDDGVSGEEDYADANDETSIESIPVASVGHFLLHTVQILSWCVGISFGRWDIRLALHTVHCLLPTDLPDPFDPLPLCPPGMLQGPDGLPAKPEDVPFDYPIRIA